MKKKWIFQSLKLLCCCALLSGLVACNKNKDEVPAYIKNPIVANLPESQRNLLEYIEKTGIQVIKQGMRFTFVIPTDCFFVRDTRELKVHREKDLDKLAQFLHRYSDYFAQPQIRIYGYTDTVWLAPARNKLSLHYAETIAEYLREDGIHARIIYVRGEGAKLPIGSNGYPMGASFNRRVVITIN